MFIQKITITVDISDLLDEKIYFKDQNQTEIELNLNSDKTVIVYYTFDIYSENNFSLYWKNSNYNNFYYSCNKCKYCCRCNYEKVHILIGNNYKGEIQLNFKETIIDDEIEYCVYIDNVYVNTY